MNLKARKKLAFKVAWRVWGQHPAPARLGKARRMIETLLNDDELLMDSDAEQRQNVLFEEAIQRLKDTEN